MTDSASPAEERPLTEDEVMRRLSADNPKSRHHREERADGWSSWTCVPIRDVIEVRVAALASVTDDERLDVERLARAICASQERCDGTCPDFEGIDAIHLADAKAFAREYASESPPKEPTE